MPEEAISVTPKEYIKNEMSSMISSFNWQATLLGGKSLWPENLKTTVNIILDSKFPMLLMWGPSKIQLYNDAFRMILGSASKGKHPQALGATAEECWKELWPTMGPQINKVYEQSESFFLEDHLIPIYREGHLDECFWTFSYSPVRGKDASVDGLLIICAETTRRVQTIRRQQTLKNIALNPYALKTQSEVCIHFLQALEKNPNDVPFALLLLADENTNELKYTGITGIEYTEELIRHFKKNPLIRKVYAGGNSQLMEDLQDAVGEIICPLWHVPVKKVHILPLFHSERTESFGILIIGISPRKHPDPDYAHFMELAAFSLSASLNHVSEANKKLVSKKAIQIGEKRLSHMISQAPVAIAIIRGPEFVIELANEKVLEYWGRTAEQVMNLPLFTALPETSEQGFEELLKNVMLTGEPLIANELPVTVMRKGSLNTTWINFIYDPLRDVNGEITGIMIVCSEVTEQVRARQSIEQAEEMLRLTIDSAKLGTWYINIKTREFLSSPRLKEFFGYYPGEVMSYKAALNQIGEEYREQVKADVEAAIKKGQSYVKEYPIIGHHDKRLRWVRASGKLYAAETEKPAHFSGTMTDITEQKLREMRKDVSLKDSNDLLESIFNSPISGIIVYKAIRNEDGTIIDFEFFLVSKLSEDFLGHKNLIGKRMLQLYPEQRNSALWASYIKVVENDIVLESENEFIRKGYSNTWIRRRSLKLGDGLVTNWIDVTEQRDAELEKKKMETIQNQKIFEATLQSQEEERKRIAESLHNGLGQLLYGVKLSLEQLRFHDEHLDVERLKSIHYTTNQLLIKCINETRQISHELTPTILEDFGLETAIQDICQQFRKSVRIECEFIGLSLRLNNYIEVTIYRTVQELLMNIVKHSYAKLAFVRLHIGNSEVKLMVKDNGVGFNDRGKKDGIGLKTIQNKIKLLNGTFSLTSEHRKDTEIHIWIPFN